MANEEKIIKLLEDIKAILVYMLSEDYANQQDMKQFCINIAADIFVEMMEKDKDFKNKIINAFRQ